MEFINKIEVQGTIGLVKTTIVGQSEVANFSVATSYAYNDKNGFPAIESTWFNVVAWHNSGEYDGNIVDFSRLQKGCAVHVVGRVRNRKYIAQNGEERTFTEIIANEVSIPSQDDLP